MDLFGLIDQFVLTDTLVLPDNIPEQLRGIELLFNFENGFPLGATLEISFLPFEGMEIESVTIGDNDFFLEPAPVSGAPEYRVTNALTKTSSLKLSDEIVANFPSYEKIVIKSSVSTTNGDHVKVYDDYHIKVSVGAKFKTRIDI